MALRTSAAILTLASVSIAPAHAVGSASLLPCDVKGAFRALDVPPGSVAVSLLGEAQDVDLLLAPVKLESGSYDVTVTRKAKDIYRVDGTSTFLVTRYCYEYVYSEKAILRYTSSGAVGAGSLTFTK